MLMNVTLLIHFPGNGGTSVVKLARKLKIYKVPKMSESSMNANLGCAKGGSEGLSGITTVSHERCPCDELYTIALQRDFNWWANENPVVAPLNCPDVAYWTVLRHPVDRIMSRLFKPFSIAHVAIEKFRFITMADAKAALTNTIAFSRNSSSREFAGSSALNNWYVRSLCGPQVYELPLGAVDRSHLHMATRQLQTFQLLVPLMNLSSITRLLEWQLGPKVRVPHIQVITRGTHSASSAWHTLQRAKALQDAAFMADLALHNKLDTELYQFVQRDFEERMREP